MATSEKMACDVHTLRRVRFNLSAGVAALWKLLSPSQVFLRRYQRDFYCARSSCHQPSIQS